MKNYVVAIDGPSGTGKSTTAKLLAQKLKVLYIDSGAMYRAVTHLALKNNMQLPADSAKIVQLAKDSKITFEGDAVLLDGNDVTKEIRSLDVTNKVSAISKIKDLRKILVEIQRDYAKTSSVIMDGRDIGTVVFPKADFKFFLVCDINTRAARRRQDFRDMGLKIPLDKIMLELKRRDEIDSTRTESPLKKAEDHIVIDTTNMIIEEQVDCLYKKVISKLDY